MLLGMVEYWMISHDLCLLRRDDIVVEKGCVIFSGWKKKTQRVMHLDNYLPSQLYLELQCTHLVHKAVKTGICYVQGKIVLKKEHKLKNK